MTRTPRYNGQPVARPNANSIVHEREHETTLQKCDSPARRLQSVTLAAAAVLEETSPHASLGIAAND
jgi:hypothetical protein